MDLRGAHSVIAFANKGLAQRKDCHVIYLLFNPRLNIDASRDLKESQKHMF